MGKRVKDHSVWIALSALLILGVWLVLDLRRPVSEPGENPKVAALVRLQPDDVVRMEIKKGGAALNLVKQGAEWKLEQPVHAPADSEEVKRIIEGVLDRTTDFILESPGDLKQYKLDKPDLEVTLTGRTGRKQTLQFGAQDPSKSNVYTRDRDSGRVFLTGNFDVDNLRKADVSSLRDKTILTVSTADVDRIEISRPSDTVVLAKEDSKWRITRPWQAPADEGQVGMVRDTFANLKGNSFVEARAKDLARYGLAHPRLTVTLQTNDGGSYALLIGTKAKDKPDVYAMRKGGADVLTIPESTFTSLDKKPSDLRSRKLVDFEAAQVEKLAGAGSNAAYELTKVGDDWRFTKPFAGQKANSSVIEGMLTDLASPALNHVTEKAAGLAQYGLEKPALTLTITLTDGTKKWVAFGKKAKGGNVYARGSDSPTAVFETSSFTFDNLNKKPDALK